MGKAISSDATLQVSTNGGTSYTTVGLAKDHEFSPSVNMVDSTDNDDGGNKTYLPGDKDATFSATLHFDPADAGQDVLRTNFDSKTRLLWRFRPDVGVGIPQYVFYGYITELPVSSAHEEMIEQSLTVQVDGGYTVTDQT